MTPGAETLLQKGRRLTEHTLDTCQLKRAKAAAVTHTQPHMPAHVLLYFVSEQWQSLCSVDVPGSGV